MGRLRGQMESNGLAIGLIEKLIKKYLKIGSRTGPNLVWSSLQKINKIGLLY